MVKRVKEAFVASALIPAWNLWNDLAGGLSRQYDMLLGHIKRVAL